MISPIQRVTKYPMLLDNFQKYLIKNGLSEDVEYINDACNMLKVWKSVNADTINWFLKSYFSSSTGNTDASE